MKKPVLDGKTTVIYTLTTALSGQYRSHGNPVAGRNENNEVNTMARYHNILDTIGNTPLVRLQRLAPDRVNLYVKVESFNPMGSLLGMFVASTTSPRAKR